MSANYTPNQSTYRDIGTFRHWCQKVLPAVYDDSLSYYEVLCKLTNYLNEVIENNNAMGKDVTSLYEAYTLLQGYVNNYFDSLEVQNEVNNGLSVLAKNGILGNLLKDYVQPIVDVQNGIIEEQTELVNNVALNNADVLAELSVLKSRMDTFTALSGGSTAGDAELADIRVGYDGESYDTAGNAVRGQYGKLSDRLGVLFEPLPIVWEDGSYVYAESGSTIENNAFSCSTTIDISKFAGFTVEVKARCVASQGITVIDNRDTVLWYANNGNTDIEGGYPTFFVKLPKNAARMCVCSLVQDKGKCYVRPAMSVGEFIEYTNSLRDSLYVKLPITWKDGYYASGEDGAINTNEELSVTDYIDVSKYANVSVEICARFGGVLGYAFYDANKNFISGASGRGTGLAGMQVVTPTVPVNAVYLCFCAYTDAKDKAYVRPIPSADAILKASGGDNSRLYPLNIAMFGDSIMWGRDGNGSHTTVSPYNIPYTVGNMLKANCDNFGVSSQGYVAEGGGKKAYDSLAEAPLASYDVITLCWGVNDHNKTLGTWDSSDGATVMGQFHKCIKRIYSANPNAIVIVFGPFNGRNVGSFPDYWYGNEWFEIDSLLKRACDYYGLPYVSQKGGPINGYTIQSFIGNDGVHPSDLGYKRIGAWFAGKIRELIG